MITYSIIAIVALQSVPVRYEKLEQGLEAQILYVDDDAALGGNGLTWNSAYRYLQDALDAARQMPTVKEIHVGQGTYLPDHGANVRLLDQNASFHIVSGTALLGSYAGVGAQNPDERDFKKYPSLLSGDLLGNDQPDFVNYQDNSFAVSRAIGTDALTVIDGVILHGNTDTPSVHPIQGAFNCESGSCTIRNCVFRANFGFWGAGISIQSAHVWIVDSAFRDNYAFENGGAIVSTASIGTTSYLSVDGCSFVHNRARYFNGGAMWLSQSAQIRNCAFVNNVGDNAGAILGAHNDIQVADCLFQNNSGVLGGAVLFSGQYIRCRFEQNLAGFNGGVYCGVSVSNASFVDCDFVNNVSILEGGVAYSNGGLSFINCRFIANHGSAGFDQPSGAIFAFSNTTNVVGCTFTGNTSGKNGGAIAVRPEASAIVLNSTFAYNHADNSGQAIYGPAIIRNCIFGKHASVPLVGVASVDYSTLPPDFPAAGIGNIAADPRFVNALGLDGIAGTEDDDLRLLPDSPCIDSADTTALPADDFDLDVDGDFDEPLPLDAFGNTRTLDLPAAPNTGVPGASASAAIVDMGAHEYRRPPDVFPFASGGGGGDGAINIDDLLTVITHWGPCDPASATCPGDVDDNHAVNADDLMQVLSGWDF